MTFEVTFRTLNGTTFTLPTNETETVLELKRKIAGHQSVTTDHSAYRLICQGKILSDDSSVADAGITPEKFVVVMPPKKTVAKTPKPTAAASSAAAATAAGKSSPASAPAAESKPASTPVATTATTTASTTAPASAPTDSNTAASSLLVGEEYEASVKRICEMGFPEDQVKRAMRAAFNNPDRAVEFIFNGIPDMPDAPMAPAPGPPPSTPSQTTAAQAPPAPHPAESAASATPFNMFEPSTAAATAGSGGGGNLDFLREIPQFTVMRRLLQANPALLRQILQQLETVNPDLVALIEANQEEFSNLINEPLREGEEANDEVMSQLAQAMAESGGLQGAGAGPEPGQIVVTVEERDQINRLTELASTIGLEHAHVVRTWLACNRDETLTANFLVDHADELRAESEQNGGNDAANNPSSDPAPGSGGPPA